MNEKQLKYTDYLINKLIQLKDYMRDNPGDYTKQISNIANSIDNLLIIHDVNIDKMTNSEETINIRNYVIENLLD